MEDANTGEMEAASHAAEATSASATDHPMA